jgi:hypothetical protein
MVEKDMHLLFQQLGEMLSSIRGLHDTINIRQAQTEQLHELVRSDLATLRRDHRDLEEKFDYVLLIAQRDIERLRSSSLDNARSIGDLVSAIDTLRKPISQLLALKSRVAGILFSAGALGSCALWLAEPVYRWFTDLALQRR